MANFTEQIGVNHVGEIAARNKWMFRCISSSVFPKNRKEKFPILGIGYSHISAGNIFI